MKRLLILLALAAVLPACKSVSSFVHDGEVVAKAGKRNGYLLEGMACPGGCVAGAGTMQAIKKSQTAVGLYAKKANHQFSSETEYIKELDKLVD